MHGLGEIHSVVNYQVKLSPKNKRIIDFTQKRARTRIHTMLHSRSAHSLSGIISSSHDRTHPHRHNRHNRYSRHKHRDTRTLLHRHMRTPTQTLASYYTDTTSTNASEHAQFRQKPWEHPKKHTSSTQTRKDGGKSESQKRNHDKKCDLTRVAKQEFPRSRSIWVFIAWSKRNGEFLFHQLYLLSYEYLGRFNTEMFISQ